jgi:tetratricopeptide (TPR) repeat protein
MYETILSKFKNNNGYNFRLDNLLLNLRNSLGRNKESIELYKKRILEYPDDPSEYVFLAIAYLYADQVHEAKKVMEAAEKIVTIPDANFYDVYGSVYQRLGDNEKALEYWDKAVQDQFSMGGWFSRAFLFKELGRLEEAAAEWNKIINMLEKHHDPLHLIWPREELAKIKEQLKKQ